MDNAFAVLGIDVDWRPMMTFASLLMTRLVLVTTTIPFLTGKPVPAQIRVGLAVALTVFLYPFLAPGQIQALPEAPLTLFLLYLKEAFYGMAIGISSSIVFHGAQAAGNVIDNQRGAAQARLLNLDTGQVSIFGQFFYLMTIVLFLTSGGHLFFLKTLVASYELLPVVSLPAAVPDLMAMVDEFMVLTGKVLVLSIQLTAPILISIFVADVILGIVSKTAPAINVWEMGFAIRGILGVVMTFLGIGVIASQIGLLLGEVPESIYKILKLLSISSP